MKLPFGSKSAPGWLALSQRGDEIDVAHVVRDGARARVSLCATYPCAAGAVPPLARLRRERGLTRFRCTTLLGASQYQLNAVEAPNVPPEERSGAARWRIKELIDYPVEAATIDVLDIPVEASARTHQLYAVSAKNEIVAATVRRFQDAGVPLAAIDIPEMAQRNVSALFGSRTAAWRFWPSMMPAAC